MMKKSNWILALCCAGLMLGVVLNSGGCGGDSSPVVIQTQGQLHGDWGGVFADPVSGRKAQFVKKIIHEPGSRNFSGSMTLDGEEYSVTGAVENNAVSFTADHPKWRISYSGKYTGGRLNGTYVRTGSTLATASMLASQKAALTTSGTSGSIKFLNIPDTITMGPWLLYTQDNAKSVSNMTVRLGLNADNLVAAVTATDNTGKTYGPHPMVQSAAYVYDETTIVDRNYVGIFQYTFSGLPSNSSFSYTVNIQDDKGKAKGTVTASFSTPPSRNDIDNKVISNQVFYSFGDNRRLFGSEDNNLPYVEQNLVLNTDLINHASSQSFLSHNGDANTFGRHIDIDTATSMWRHAGWKAEWLSASNDANVVINSNHLSYDARYHTWLRASIPTYMSAGNHEGKDVIQDGAFTPPDFYMYGSLMAGIYNDNANDNIMLQHSSGAAYDSYTYMADHGGIRNIVLNTYNCYTKAEAQTILGRIKTWIDGAYAGGPVVLSLHPTIFVDSDEVGAADCWNTSAQIKADIQPLINGKKNVIVIMGHVHETARTVYNDVNYYILGTGGASDMGANKNTSWMVDFSNKNIAKPPYLNFAYGQFSVDYSARKITATLYGMGGLAIDVNSWNY